MSKTNFLTLGNSQINYLRKIILDYERKHKNEIYPNFNTVKIDEVIYNASKNNIYNYIKNNYNKKEGNILEYMFSYDDLEIQQIIHLQTNLERYQSTDYYKPILNDLETIIVMLCYVKNVKKITLSMKKTSQTGVMDKEFKNFLTKLSKQYNL